jgi:hypothetical protein
MISRSNRLRISSDSIWFLFWEIQIFHVYKTVYSSHESVFDWCQIETMNFYLFIYQNSNVLKNDEKMKEVKSNDQVRKYIDAEMINEFDEETLSFVNEKMNLKTWKLNKNDDENNMNIIEIFD